MKVHTVIYGHEETSVSVHGSKVGATRTAALYVRSIMKWRVPAGAAAGIRRLIRAREYERAVNVWNENIFDDSSPRIAFDEVEVLD